MPWGPLWWSRGPEGHPMDILGSRYSFLSILGCLWGISWVYFGSIFLICCWFGVSKWETGSRSIFLVIQGWKWCQDAEAVCARTIIKTRVLEIFHFFHVFTNLVSPGRVLGVIWVTFGDLGRAFSNIWGYWGQARNLIVFQGSPRGSPNPATPPSGG